MHMDDLHGTGPKPALDLVQTNFSQKVRFKVWTVYEIGIRYEHLKRKRVLHNDRTEVAPKPKYLRILIFTMSCSIASSLPLLHRGE